MKDYAYILFISEMTKSKKTQAYSCLNKLSHSKLGTVKWYAHWRQYCFFPSQDIVFSKGCLEDICDFISGIMKDWRDKK